MSSEEFWKDDPKLFSSYLKAYQTIEKRKAEKINYSNWLQGLYIYDGLKKSLKDFGYAFIAGKNDPDFQTYPNKPYDLFGKEENGKVKEREKVKNQNQKNLNFWARLKK